MSATNAFEQSVLNLIFAATAIANIADNAASVPATLLYISLHTADPGETGTQTTSEATYTSYARISVSRVSGGAGWVITGTTSITNNGNINFATCTGGSNTITHFGVGLSSSGAGTLLLSGALTASLAVSNGITPFFAPGTLVVTAD